MSDDLKKMFEQIFDDYYRRLLVHALRFVQDENEAEDIVADVFMICGNALAMWT